MTVRRPFQLSPPTGLMLTADWLSTRTSRRVLDANTPNTEKQKVFPFLAGLRFRTIQSKFSIIFKNSNFFSDEFQATVWSDWTTRRCCLSAEKIGEIMSSNLQFGSWKTKFGAKSANFCRFEKIIKKNNFVFQANYRGSAIYVDRFVFYFGYDFGAIERIDLDENEELQNVVKIGNTPGQYFYPVLFRTYYNFCIWFFVIFNKKTFFYVFDFKKMTQKRFLKMNSQFQETRITVEQPLQSQKAKTNSRVDRSGESLPVQASSSSADLAWRGRAPSASILLEWRLIDALRIASRAASSSIKPDLSNSARQLPFLLALALKLKQCSSPKNREQGCKLLHSTVKIFYFKMF